jgi:hypothetical protein
VTDPPGRAGTGTLVDVPGDLDVHGSFDVYVNGILQEHGTDYHLDGRTLIFARALTPEVRMSKLQFVRAALGIAGTYRKHDSIDIIYERHGRRLVATGLRPRNPDRPTATDGERR